MNELIHNGVATGTVASTFLAHDCNPAALRPWLGRDNCSYVTMKNEKGESQNIRLSENAATLRLDEWKLLDDAVVKAATNRLRIVADLRAQGLVYTIPQGMGKTIFQTETQSNIEDAEISMDGVREGNRDRPQYNTLTLPLPITFYDFSFSLRQIQTSRNGGSPLDTSMAELAGRKVAESIEKLTIGATALIFPYGAGNVYGITTLPSRMTKTLTDPTSTSWTGTKFLNDVLSMREKAKVQNHYGPYTLYVATSWDQYLDSDFKAASDKSLRNRVREIDDFLDVRTLDNLATNTVMLVQMTSDVIRMVNAMEPTILQWETTGGLMVHFKVMTIQVPQVRLDYENQGGIVHGTV